MILHRNLAMSLLLLAGAAAAIFVTGTHDVAALALVLAGAGAGLLVGCPREHPSWLPLVAGVLFLAACALSLVPGDPGNLPSWRAGAPDGMDLGSASAAMPGLARFWLAMSAAAVVAGLFFLASPLGAGELRVFLHAVAAFVAAYAAVSIVQAHTTWSYPFSGGANFGLLPNRNHTATLLMTGAIVAFGLMQWEVTRRHRVGAVLAAIWGAPPLAALLFFSVSRAGVLFLAAGLLLWGAGAAGWAAGRRTTVGAAAVLAGFLAILFVTGGSTVSDRWSALWQDAMAMETGEAGGRELDFRQPVFADTLSMIVDAPFTGQGLGHFEFAFPHYREASLRAVRVFHPESDWLMVAAESGIPALLILLTLVGWYFVQCWRARGESGGLLRWTVASAIGAALLHGLIDVPWHRPALGWFLLVVAVAALPSRDHPLHQLRLWHGLQIATGLLLLGAGVYLILVGTGGRPPLAYRWEAYDQELRTLGEARRHDDGEFVAREAIRDFPLNYQAYYWRAAFLCTFEGTDREIGDDVRAGRFVEPVLPVVAAEQAQVWAGINDLWEAECRAEAVRRAVRIEARSGLKGAAVGELEKGLRAAQDRPGVQVALREHLQDQPVMLGHWVCSANADLADHYLADLGPAAGPWLDALPDDLRGRVLDRWVTLPSAAGAVAYMEHRGGARVYGRPLAGFYAREGVEERAVRIVAEAEEVPLDGTLPEGAWARQLAALRGQGNEVAVRRLVREAVEAKEPDVEKLRVAMAMYAAAGDWEMAWKAASRLATATKNRQ